MASTPDTLTLYVGSADPMRLSLWDTSGVGLSLGDVDEATFEVEAELGDGDPVEEYDAGSGGGLAIDAANKRLVCTPSQAQADARVAGSYIGRAKLHFQATDSWRFTAPVRVEILP